MWFFIINIYGLFINCLFYIYLLNIMKIESFPQNRKSEDIS